MFRFRTCSLAMAVAFTRRIVVSPVTVESSNEESTPPPLRCDLYLAESTIPNAGMGSFTAVSKEAGDKIGEGDVVFPLLDLEWYHNFDQLDLEWDINYHNPFVDYVWDGITMGMGMECDRFNAVTALWPGLDCAINSLIPLENVYRAFPRHSSHGHDDDVLTYMPHRSKDPGAGAITPYRSAAQTIVKRHIPAGGELFKSYGDDWFTTRPYYFDKGLPLSHSFPQAQSLLDRVMTALQFPPLYDLLLDLRQVWSHSRTLRALPVTTDDIQLSLQKDITHTYQANATRSLEWLQEHGTCIDHIVQRPSTIPGAGEGAFAKRHLPKGTVVTGSPLIIIPNERLLDMVELHLGVEMKQGTKSLPVVGKQIILNYCLGHHESTLLFFPYGSGLHYINHDAARPNIKLRWASKPGLLRHDPTLLNVTAERMEKETFGPNLGIEYVALRDIAKGEELFLDYGPEWDAAWREHVENWKAPLPQGSTIAADWNRRSDELLRTIAEQDLNPYPDTIQTRCHVNLIDPAWKPEADDFDWVRFETDAGTNEYLSVYGLPCDILERSSDDTPTYTVELGTDFLTFVQIPKELQVGGKMTLSSVPREAIFFLDEPYESDLYLEGAFRHFIEIPEDMMPDAWRNKKPSQGGNHARIRNNKSSFKNEL